MISSSQYSRTYGAPAQQLRGDFYMDTIKDELASRNAGREIHKEVERVRVIIPGAVASIVVKNVDDTHRQRWPEQYAAFKAGREQPLSGTALVEWPVLNRAMVEELHHLKVRTVEELANLSDIQVQNIGMGGQMLRARARAFLDDAEHEALTTKLVGENDVLRSRVASLEAQVNELGQQMVRVADRERRFYDDRHPYATHVPGDNDPFEQRKAFQGNLVEPEPSSALDVFANMAPPTRRRGELSFDPAAADDGGDESETAA
jgi:hypothetical protein